MTLHSYRNFKFGLLILTPFPLPASSFCRIPILIIFLIYRHFFTWFSIFNLNFIFYRYNWEQHFWKSSWWKSKNGGEKKIKFFKNFIQLFSFVLRRNPIRELGGEFENAIRNLRKEHLADNNAVVQFLIYAIWNWRAIFFVFW